MNQTLAFALLGVGGIALTKAVTGSSWADILAGHPGTPTTTGQQLASSGVAGAGASVATAAGNATSGSTALTGNSNAQRVFDFYTSHGFSPQAAAGFVGNYTQESNINPAEAGGGLAQWIGARWTSLVNFAASIRAPVNDLETQLQFSLHELQGSPGLVASLNAASTPQEAALLISDQYERPAAWAANNSRRESVAAAAYNAYAG